MADGSSVTLIFYRIGEDWYREPFLNLLSAAAQGSRFTHVEIALGEDSGSSGAMRNVCRIFNDATGVELCERTGRNPKYSYVQLGCSRAQVQHMLAFARRQVGKPFSNLAMARSLVFPRTSDNSSFFCAELVASVLKVGGLMCPNSNPGAATPHSLFKTYSKSGAATGNPFLLRSSDLASQLTFSTSTPAPRLFAPQSKQTKYRVLPSTDTPSGKMQLSLTSLGPRRAM